MKVVSPCSIVVLDKCPEGGVFWANKVGKYCRIGFYSKQDTVEIIWLVNQQGEYIETASQNDFLKYFSIVEDSQIEDYFGDSHDPLEPIPLDQPDYDKYRWTDENTDKGLMILQNPVVCFPVALSAFTLACATRKELRKYVGGKLLLGNGKVVEVLSVKAKSLYGTSLILKIVSALFSEWNIETTFSSPIPCDFLDLKEKILTWYGNEPDSEAKEIINIEKLKASDNIEELLTSITLPPIDDCLDVL